MKSQELGLLLKCGRIRLRRSTDPKGARSLPPPLYLHLVAAHVVYGRPRRAAAEHRETHPFVRTPYPLPPSLPASHPPSPIPALPMKAERGSPVTTHLSLKPLTLSHSVTSSLEELVLRGTSGVRGIVIRGRPDNIIRSSACSSSVPLMRPDDHIA